MNKIRDKKTLMSQILTSEVFLHRQTLNCSSV